MSILGKDAPHASKGICMGSWGHIVELCAVCPLPVHAALNISVCMGSVH